jgi:hypothetical protein
MVGEPEPIPQAPAEDIQASINYLAGLPKMNIPQIPDIEEIKRKMAEANMNFPEPVSYPDQLQAIRDLPPMNQMPTREEIQAVIQNIPTPRPAPQVVNNYTALDPDRALSAYGQRQQDAPMNQMPTREEIQAAIQNIPAPVPAPRPAPAPAQTIQEKIQAIIQNIPTPIPEPMVFPSIPKFSSPVPQMPTREEIQIAMQNIPTPRPSPAPVFTPAQTIQEEIQAAMQNMPTQTASASSMPKFNLHKCNLFFLKK